MAQEKVTFDVLQGPSKGDLQTAVFHGKSEEQLRVRFKIKATQETTKKSHLRQDLRLATLFLKARLQGAVRADGSGENWVINGMLYLDDVETAFSGTYSTQRRTGFFTLTFEGVAP
ncbi:MAG: hypothetical protein WC866_05320 [Patescibacteria group bacterium]|jgi:hypothetical protein